MQVCILLKVTFLLNVLPFYLYANVKHIGTVTFLHLHYRNLLPKGFGNYSNRVKNGSIKGNAIRN